MWRTHITDRLTDKLYGVIIVTEIALSAIDFISRLLFIMMSKFDTDTGQKKVDWKVGLLGIEPR